MSGEKIVLGVSGLFHDSAAALVKGNKVLAAAQEERFTRKKGDASFPVNSIKYCLRHLPKGCDLDAVAFYENPRLKMDRIFKSAVRNAPRGAPIWAQALRAVDELNRQLPKALLGILDDPEKLFFSTHHRSHAASAFYPSPFSKAAVLVVDGVGEWSTTSIWSGDRNELVPQGEVRFPHSLGLFYSAFTQYCGFKVNSGEYKLMGLAPFGNPIYEQKILDEMIDVKPDGSFTLNLKYFEFHTGVSTISPLFGSFFGEPARLPESPVSQHFMDIAASVQSVINQVMQALARSALELTGMNRLCLAGGVALNCVANSKIFLNTPGLEGVWVQPAAGDAGGALGAAFDVALQLSERPKPSIDKAIKNKDGMQGGYLGPHYSPVQIESALQRNRLVYTKYESDEQLCHAVADLLAKGQILGHFDGRMEFGPRALGNRSILADPRPVDMMSRVNLKIKFREGWRPFAPLVLLEESERLFEGITESPYMLLVSRLNKRFCTGPKVNDVRGSGVYKLAELQRSVTTEFNAISHIDYSSRLQTVTNESESRVYRILKAFHESTGCPMLLNTSFNVRGEPIVCAPGHAIKCFLNTHMDALVIGDFIVSKSAQESWVAGRVGRMKFNDD
ncbi:carbamoyltransferase family protein [Amphritea japonica]|nr:carbamoyltransferase N-terminal domain-containing protein [Amphritea japonica]